MPHVILEYTQDSASPDEISGLLDAVHGAVISSGLFEASHVKSRAIPLPYYRTGKEDRPFVHAQLRIKPGRTPSQKKALSAAVLGAIRDRRIATMILTVEVVELDAESYAKWEA